MPNEKEKLSQTMRIDLIPDVPTESVARRVTPKEPAKIARAAPAAQPAEAAAAQPVKAKPAQSVEAKPAQPVEAKPAQPVEAAPKGDKGKVMIPTPTRKHPKAAPVSGEDSHYKELLQSVYDAALITDLNGNIVDVNIRAVDFLYYEREDLVSLSVFDIISGSDENLLQTLLENLENERFTLIQAYCIRKDGTFFPSEIAVNKLNLGTMHLCFFLRDITIRRQAEETARTTYSAIQNSGNGIAVADLEAKIEYANPALANLWGYDGASDELIGKSVCDLLTDKSAAEEMIQIVMGDQQGWAGEMRAGRNDGQEFDVQISAACNRNSEGEAIGIVFSFVDISDQKRAEEALREADRHRVMLESLGAACHHLGQPATVVLANLGIIQQKLESSSDELVRELVKSSIEAAETLGDILHKLNTVNEYKTTQYLERSPDSDSVENRILDI